jgi:type II secretory pathway pseudopilin PulG
MMDDRPNSPLSLCAGHAPVRSATRSPAADRRLARAVRSDAARPSPLAGGTTGGLHAAGINSLTLPRPLPGREGSLREPASALAQRRAEPARHRRTAARPAFTIVELIVVISIIIIILAVAVPSLSAMNAEARQTSAYQTINGALTRAYYQAMADSTLTAVRFFPGAWDVVDDELDSLAPRDRQRLAIYSYVTTSSADLSNPATVQFGEYFERVRDVRAVTMPRDVWAAPLASLSNDVISYRYGNPRDGYGTDSLYASDLSLAGTVNQFAFDASQQGSFLNADDFLIVYDPRTGLRSGMPTPYPMRAYVPLPSYQYETTDTGNDGSGEFFQRYGFTGVVTYRREPFVALGDSASSADRQQALEQTGRPYMAQRFGGGLLSGAQRPAE